MNEQHLPTPRIRRMVQNISAGPIDPRFVQDRIALFGKTIFWIGTTFLLMTVGVQLSGAVAFTAAGRASHVTATLLALLVWQIARRSPPLPQSTLHVLDAVGTLGVCASMAVMAGQSEPPQPWGFFAGTLSVFHTVAARAVVIPSTPRRTLVVSALSFLFLAVSAQLMPITQVVGIEPPSELSVRVLRLVGPLMWSVTGSALATLASSVIYGLRVEVVKAQQLGQYTLERKIGAGGMGEVYRAKHALLRRPTAIKLMTGQVSESQLRRFEQEVQLTASLTHPNTISIYDFGRTPDGRFYYVMELLEGLTLQQVVARDGAQPASRVVHVLRQACDALQEAHEAGLIHRDIKPDNVFLCQLGGVCDVVKVLDFGLVKQLNPSLDTTKSNINTLIGTPQYLSPEAIAAPERVDARSDLYALGAVAYFMLTGTPVFDGRSVVEVCSMHLHTAPEPLSTRTSQVIPSELEALVLDCLAKDPSARPASAEAMATRLQRMAAAPWTREDAKRWWQTPAVTNQPLRAAEATPWSQTIKVDLRDR
ncbi:MAG: serine/threonine-protein kinase [Polyangiales bacterium]